jgi:methylmalonyl-CoA mutase
MSHLFSEFQKADHQEWLHLVEQELKTTLEPYEITKGVFANPFVGNSSVLELPQIKKSTIGWTIFQHVRGSSSSELNSKIIEALEGGASGISILLDSEEFDFESVFKDVYLSFIQVRFCFSDSFFGSSEFFENLEKFVRDKETNFVFAGLTKEEAQKASSFGKIELSSPKEGVLTENLSEVLREAEDLVFSKSCKLAINLPVQENFYLNIAQHKALKIIWGKIAEAYGQPESELLVYSNINFSHADPNAQVIAATQQTASSVFGGTNGVLIKNIPFDVEKYPANFAARITRNIQNVLWNESFLYRVSDPTKGSYFIDDFCQKLINEVWTLFIKDK